MLEDTVVDVPLLTLYALLLRFTAKPCPPPPLRFGPTSQTLMFRAEHLQGTFAN